MLQGILLDFWQRPIPVDGGEFFGDVGLAGPDGGKGGKSLLLPPSYKGEVPDGYFVYRSATYNVFVFLRAFYQDPTNLTPAVALVEQSKIYPLNGKDTAKPMKFPDASGVPANMLPLRGAGSRLRARIAGHFQAGGPADTAIVHPKESTATKQSGVK
jgi:hypothetical protein